VGRKKTGRPVDVPVGSGIAVTGQDFEQRAPIIPPGSVSYIYSGQFRTSSKTASFTLSNEMVVLVDATSVDIVITLPAASTSTHKIYYIKKVDSTGHTVTVKGNATAETIDGEKSIVIALQYQYIAIICDGSDWFIIGGEYVKIDELLRQILSELKEANETAKKSEDELKEINS